MKTPSHGHYRLCQYVSMSQMLSADEKFPRSLYGLVWPRFFFAPIVPARPPLTPVHRVENRRIEDRCRERLTQLCMIQRLIYKPRVV